MSGKDENETLEIGGRAARQLVRAAGLAGSDARRVAVERPDLALLAAWLDGKLKAAEAAPVERWLALDPQAPGELEILRRALDLPMIQADAPAPFVAKVQALVSGAPAPMPDSVPAAASSASPPIELAPAPEPQARPVAVRPVTRPSPGARPSSVASVQRVSAGSAARSAPGGLARLLGAPSLQWAATVAVAIVLGYGGFEMGNRSAAGLAPALTGAEVQQADIDFGAQSAPFM